MRIMKQLTLWSMSLMTALVLMAFTQDESEKKAWEIPAKYQQMNNPLALGDADILKTGKVLYAKHCKVCHGNFGKGNGPRARALQTSMMDFTGAEFKNQTDGAIYFQSIIGRDEMPNYEKKIASEADRWALITYIRSLK